MLSNSKPTLLQPNQSSKTQRILFKPFMLDQIVLGNKTETRRLMPRPVPTNRMFIGEAVAKVPTGVHPSGRIYKNDYANVNKYKYKFCSPLHMLKEDARYFIDVNYYYIEPLLSITEEAAITEGFQNKNHFLDYFGKIHGVQLLNSNPIVMAINFKLATL